MCDMTAKIQRTLEYAYLLNVRARARYLAALIRTAAVYRAYKSVVSSC
jgi:hypothetical protein